MLYKRTKKVFLSDKSSMVKPQKNLSNLLKKRSGFKGTFFHETLGLCLGACDKFHILNKYKLLCIR